MPEAEKRNPECSLASECIYERLEANWQSGPKDEVSLERNTFIPRIFLVIQKDQMVSDKTRWFFDPGMASEYEALQNSSRLESEPIWHTLVVKQGGIPEI